MTEEPKLSIPELLAAWLVAAFAVGAAISAHAWRELMPTKHEDKKL